MRPIVLCCLLFFSLTPGWAQKEIIDKVVALVGGEYVLLSEVEEQLALLKSQRPGEPLPPDARCMIIEQVLASKLLLNQAKLDSVEVKDDEIENQLNARVERILGYMNNDVAQFEAYYGQTVSQVKDQLREDLRNQLLSERMRGQVMGDITVTPSEVKAFFQKIPRDSLPYFNSEVEVGEIVYKPKVNEEEKRKAIEQMETVRKRIVEGGEDFGLMAQKYSDDGSARAGGDLGWAKRGKFVPEFEAAAYKLAQDEVSPVVESEFGYHLIQMLGRRGNTIHLRHILAKPEITDADVALARHVLDSIRILIVSDSMSFSYAVKKFSDDKQQSYNNDGRMVNPVTGNTFFEVGDLEPDIYFAIDTMDVGQISSPIEFSDPAGDPFLRLIQLQSRTKPHRASLDLDYSKIQDAAIESKRNDFLNSWIEDKIRRTYVQVDPSFRACPNIEDWFALQSRAKD